MFRPCRICGGEKNDKGKCPPCERRRKSAWVTAHPEAARAAQRKGNVKFRAKHPDRAKASDRKTVLRRKYNITPEDYFRLASVPNNKCSICLKSNETENRALAIDHDHLTKIIRGLLCTSCNLALGGFKDSTELLLRAVEYLKGCRMHIVGISGKSGHGKDTIAACLINKGYVKIAFADALKDGAAAMFGFTQDQLHGITKDNIDSYWKMSPRQILQKLGTEAMRQVFGDEIWIAILKMRLDVVRLGPKPPIGVVISDVRFPNEANAILVWGGEVWRVSRPGVAPVNPHVSETALDEFEEFSAHIPNDGSLDDLYGHVRDLIG